MIELKLQSLPDVPGVYRFLGVDQSVLYVGKATSLRNRVRSYFTGTHSPKTEALVRHICDIEVTVTDSPFEALLLENTFIKEYRPKYNILLKDDRSYPYVKLTHEKFPRLITAYHPTNDGAQYFGPYASATEAQFICRVLNESYPIVKSKSCSRRAPCFYYQLGMCLAPYYFAVDPAVYQNMLDDIIEFLRGDRVKVLTLMKNRMSHAANLEHYEAAAKIRDEIKKLEDIDARQKVILNRPSNIDVLGYAVHQESICIYLMVIRNGIWLDGFGTIVERQDNAMDDVREYIERYYFDKPAPETLLLPAPVRSDIFAFKRFTAVVPKRGYKRNLLQLASKNASVYLACNEPLAQRE